MWVKENSTYWKSSFIKYSIKIPKSDALYEGFFVIFAAFFPWKTATGMVKYACKVTSSRCLSQSFTAVHEDIPKCMPEEHLLLEPVKLDIRGFESRRASQDVSPVAWFCPSGRKKNGTRNRVRERV